MRLLPDPRIHVVVVAFTTSLLVAACGGGQLVRPTGAGGTSSTTGGADGGVAGANGGVTGANGGIGGTPWGTGGPREGAGRTGTNGGSGGGGGDNEVCTPVPTEGDPTAGAGGHPAGGGGAGGTAGGAGQSGGGGGRTDRVSFSAPVTYKIGRSPLAIAVADLNDDGRADVAVTAQGTATTSGGVTLLFNRGDGTLADATLLAAEGEPQSLAIADLNGDGKNDLALAVWNVVGNTGAVRVLVNGGDGTFPTIVSYPVPAEARSVAAADLNADNRADLVVAYGDGGAARGVAALLNQGSGTFGAATTYPAGAAPSAIALGDLNRDGKPDVVAASYGTEDTVHVLLNRGDGTLAAAVSYPGGEWLNSAAIADLDGDGLGDVVVASDDGINVFLNRGAAVFGSPVTYAMNAGEHSLAVGDMDGDGRADLISTKPLSFGTSGWSGGNVVVRLNNGDGTFIPSASFSERAVGGRIALGNLNGDARNDLVAVNGYYECAYSVSVLLSDAR